MTRKCILSLIMLIAVLSGALLLSCQHGAGNRLISSDGSVDWNDSCFALLKQALAYYNNNETDSLEQFAAWSMEICAEHNQRQWYYNIWAVLAEAYVWDNQFDKATDEAHRMQEEAEKRKEGFGQFLAYKTLGVGYAHAGNSHEAVPNLKKAIGYFPKGATPGELFYCYHSLCQEQLKMKHYTAVDSTLRGWQTEVNRYPVIVGDSEATVHANFHFSASSSDSPPISCCHLSRTGRNGSRSRMPGVLSKQKRTQTDYDTFFGDLKLLSLCNSSNDLFTKEFPSNWRQPPFGSCDMRIVERTLRFYLPYNLGPRFHFLLLHPSSEFFLGRVIDGIISIE